MMMSFYQILFLVLQVNRENRGETTEISLSGSEEQVALAEQKINEIANDTSSSFSRPYDRNDNNSRPFERNDYQKSYERQNNSGSYDRNDRPYDRSENSRQGRNERYDSNFSQNRNDPPQRFPDRPSYSDSSQNNYCRQPEPEPDTDPNFKPIDWSAVYQESVRKFCIIL